MELYKLLLIERENDGKRLWVLFSVMSVINGALLAFVASEKVQNQIIVLVLIFLGGLVSFLWGASARRMTEWIIWWENKLVEIEAAAFDTARNNDEIIPTEFKLFQDRKLEKDKGWSSKWVSYFLPFIFLFFWFTFFVIKAYEFGVWC